MVLKNYLENNNWFTSIINVMKKIILLSVLVISVTVLNAQQFTKLLGDARASYKSGKLEDTRFAMQQMLQELDLITGKEILKILPMKMGDAAAIPSKDNVTLATGFVGVMIHREYGTNGPDDMSIEIITNSPLIASINGILSMPLIGGL